MAIYQLDAQTPELADSAWVADSAQVMGAVKIAADASVWFGVTVRGDNEPIQIGEGSNIQDGSVLHSDHGMPLLIGKHVTVGHRVILHGCTIGDESLIGMGAVVLNGAKIGKNCLVGAGALVMLLELINPRVRGAEALASVLGKRVLVSIPYIHTRAELARRKQWRVRLVIIGLVIFTIFLVLVHFLYMPLDLLMIKALGRFA